MCFVAVADWPALEATRADVVAFLRPFRHLDLPYTRSVYQLIDLDCSVARHESTRPGTAARHAMLVRR